MASSSSSIKFPYDVFLSFRGEDTRYTITGDLYHDLISVGFRTFLDDDGIERGEDIKAELQRAIQESSVFILLISENYANSSWCLDELLLILAHSASLDRHVLPVFYKIDPSDMRKQNGKVAEAFQKHEMECRTPEQREKIQQWKNGLIHVANLGGFCSLKVGGYEYKFREEIVTVIQGKLSRVPLSIDSHLVGLGSQVSKINLWLHDKSIEVGILILCGTGGIGKTTVAKYIYNLNQREYFRYSSFLSDIRENCKETKGLRSLQRRLISHIQSKKVDKIEKVDEGATLISRVLRNKKFFLILDDIDEIDQLEAILGKDRPCPWIYKGSRIIITTRRKDLINHIPNARMHMLENLGHRDSSELLSWHAFRQKYQKDETYAEQFQKFLSHCQGLPLALKVLGSSLINKTPDEWTMQLKKLEDYPEISILRILRISYESLQETQHKDLFLDIACFFVGKKKEFVTTVLDACGLHAAIGIRDLSDRCLLEVNESNRVVMHHMLQDMGKQIVREESEKFPEKRTRLWRDKDSFVVLCDKSGTESIEGLILDMNRLKKDESALSNSYNEPFETKAFENMKKLRILHLNYSKFVGGFEVVPKILLRCLCWRGFPAKSIPNDFPLYNLVYLDMRNSSLVELFIKGNKVAVSLKIINISYSHRLYKVAGLSVFPNMEKLVLKDCPMLSELHESIEELQRLNFLILRNCKRLRKLPRNIHLVKSLEKIDIRGCTNFEGAEELKNMNSLRELYADGVPINQLLSTPVKNDSWPAFMWSLVSTRKRKLETSWMCLPSSLDTLTLEGCNISDECFPKDLSNLSMLRHLSLGHNPLIHNLPGCISDLNNLKILQLRFCHGIQEIQWPSSLASVEKLDVTSSHSIRKITWTTSNALPRSIEHGDCPKLNHVENGFKIKPLKEVDVDLIKRMGFFNLNYIANSQVTLSSCIVWSRAKYPIQVIYESGIFSTFYNGTYVPRWFTKRSLESIISLRVPKLPNYLNLRITGLNTCMVYKLLDSPKWIRDDQPISIEVQNRSTNEKAIYLPRVVGIPENENETLVWLCYWFYGLWLEEDDELEVLFMMNGGQLMECGVQVLCDEYDIKGTGGQSNLSSPHLFFDGNFNISIPVERKK